LQQNSLTKRTGNYFGGTGNFGSGTGIWFATLESSPNEVFDTHRHRYSASCDSSIARYLDERNDELLDGIVTAAALVASADGRIEPSERHQLIDFLNRNGLLSVFTREEILNAFEYRVRQCEQRAGATGAFDHFRPLRGRSSARLVIQAGEQVAAADGLFHLDEFRILRRIRSALAALGPTRFTHAGRSKHP